MFRNFKLGPCRNYQCGAALLLLLLTMVSAPLGAEISSPVGIWQIIDTDTRAPLGLVQITQAGLELEGTIIKVNQQVGHENIATCAVCTGRLHNKPLVGVTILAGITAQGADQWGGGTILNPKNGQVYHCMLTLSPDAQSLQVRGYIGSPWLGHSQKWLRISAAPQS